LDTVIDIQASPETEVCVDVSGYIYCVFSHIEQRILISERVLIYLSENSTTQGLKLGDANLCVCMVAR
jgi:hypothetical protein